MNAVVTGAAGAIGSVICQRLAADGYQVTGLDVAPGDGVVACDVADADQVAAVAERCGPAEVLVNCAGLWRFAPLEEVSPADFARVLQVNLIGAFNTTVSFGPAMLQRGRGSIVNIVSIAAAHANPAVGAYSASKAGLVALTRQTALEWGPRGVRANAVGPGLIPTEGAGLYGDDDVRARRAAAVPLGRLGTPADIAEAVSFLASERASYITGQVLYVDGGVSESLMTTLPRPPAVASPSLGPR